MGALGRRLLPSARGLGPYVLVELLLPGGTLIALLLWLSQGVARSGLFAIEQPIITPAAVEQVIAPAANAAVALARGVAI